MNKKKRITVLVIPDGTEKTKRFSISIGIIKAVVLVIGIIGISFLTLIYSVFDQQYRSHELFKTKKLVVEQNNQIMNFSNKIQDLQSRLESLQQLDMKIRILANIENPRTNNNTTYSMGGPTLDMGGYSIPSSDVNKGMLVKKMNMDMNELLSKTGIEEQSLHQIYEGILDKKDILLATPSIWPARGWITSPFGMRIDPFTGKRALHEGIDIATQTGNPVIAPANGIVTHAGPDDGFGNAVIIDHGYGVTTLYGHLSRVDVKVGQIVKRGQLIGNIGDTGMSTGPHLHYQVMINGVPVNPMRYLIGSSQ
ncbi:MAG: M23 family metallopeptidase [Deltaproteobacteria bacterium]|nr:M23 family metallopeptidase [Deltaproteobacteria bacterium]MCL5791410.1 M23 family metallopeptidase [Deltaproteobacteria bacterium]